MADVIVVSVYAADALPLEVYAWINAWLPRRNSRMGVLKALIGVAETQDSKSVHTREYFQDVARQGELDFLPQERLRPFISAMKLITERASPPVQTLLDLCDLPYRAYSHWGLNE